MIRLLMFLFGKDYEECKSCLTLKEQLDYERAEKAQLTETLLEILRPKTIEAAPVEINPLKQSTALFSRRRAALEESERLKAKILTETKNLGVPDNLKDIKDIKTNEIDKLEAELGIDEEKGA